jgi:hypothetical protein
VRTEDWKLVYTPGVHHDIWRLYDLRTDSHCERDVKHAYPNVLRAMRAKLLQWTDERRESRICEIFPDEGVAPAGERIRDRAEEKDDLLAAAEPDGMHRPH